MTTSREETFESDGVNEELVKDVEEETDESAAAGQEQADNRADQALESFKQSIATQSPGAE
eukprot:5714303-Amphidinium_carterae.1